MIKLLFIVCFIIFASFTTTKGANPVSETVLSEEKPPTGNLELKDEAGNVLITIEDVKSVEVSAFSNSFNSTEYCVKLEFTEEGTLRFKEVTETLIGEVLYIYVDDQCISAPYVYDTISDGIALISGLSSYEEACEIADAIQGYR